MNVKGRYIGESIRLISDILESSTKYNIPGYVFTVDLEKAFDSIDHTFLFALLEKFGIGENFIILFNQLKCKDLNLEAIFFFGKRR